MRLLFVSDGRFPAYVNGVSIYLHYLARELAEGGHDVSILHVVNSKLFGRPRLKRATEDGIRYFGILNSPLFMGDSLENPLGDLREDRLETIFLKVLTESQPDIVHFHELHRLPASTMRLAREEGIKVVATLHDYWYLCPLFQLFTPQERVCPGPQSGRNCVVTCLAPGRATRIYRRLMRIFRGTPYEGMLGSLRNRLKRVRREPVWQTSRGQQVAPEPKNLRLTGKIARLGEREEVLKELLSAADAIHAVSNATREVYTAHSIPREKVSVIQLGVKAADWLEPAVKRFEKPPLKVGFLGHLGPSKGAQVLVAAARRFSKEEAEFHLFGGGREEDRAYVREAGGEIGHIFYRGPYHYRKLGDVFEQFHVLVVPSVWVETLGLIGLEAQAAGVPVVASAIGGMLDYVEHGVNGLLFAPGDEEDLSRNLRQLIEEPHLLKEMSENARQPITIRDHLGELLKLYERVAQNG